MRRYGTVWRVKKDGTFSRIFPNREDRWLFRKQGAKGKRIYLQDSWEWHKENGYAFLRDVPMKKLRWLELPTPIATWIPHGELDRIGRESGTDKRLYFKKYLHLKRKYARAYREEFRRKHPLKKRRKWE
jgi:hypothetical protein